MKEEERDRVEVFQGKNESFLPREREFKCARQMFERSGEREGERLG